MRFFLIFIFSFTILFSAKNKVVKTSELELFLFKIGFESLLKDVDLTKNKSTLNEKQLKILDKKVEYIMNELKKNNIKIKEDSTIISSTSQNISNNEIKFLKSQINKLQEQIDILQKKDSSSYISQNTFYNEGLYVVKAEFAHIKSRAYRSSRTIRKVSEGKILKIKSCDRFNWCRLKNERAYVAKYLVKPL